MSQRCLFLLTVRSFDKLRMTGQNSTGLAVILSEASAKSKNLTLCETVSDYSVFNVSAKGSTHSVRGICSDVVW